MDGASGGGEPGQREIRGTSLLMRIRVAQVGSVCHGEISAPPMRKHAPLSLLDAARAMLPRPVRIETAVTRSAQVSRLCFARV